MSAEEYKPPQWSALPKFKTFLEVMKGGSIINTIEMDSKEFYSFGRAPDNDVVLDHASISRHHCILQFSDEGVCCLYDLGSSHGTYLNKKRVFPKAYIRVPPGSTIRFGESTRLYALNQELPEDVEQKLFAKRFSPEKGIENVEEILQNPVSSLKSWMERNGLELEIIAELNRRSFEEEYSARIVLPQELIEGHGPSNADAEKDACKKACEFLIENNLWWQRTESALLGSSNRNLDREDDDDDEFFDRTRRNVKKDKEEPTIETAVTLNKKLTELKSRKAEITLALEGVKAVHEADDDELNAYMNSINDKVAEQQKSDLQKQLSATVMEIEKIEKLAKLAGPIPEQDSLEEEEEAQSSRDTGPKQAPMPSAGTKRSGRYGLRVGGSEKKTYTAALPPEGYVQKKPKYEDDVEEWVPPE